MLFYLHTDARCPEGQYSDVSLVSEECKPCPPGTHSKGGAVHYSNWTVLPPEFDTYSVKSYDERMHTEIDAGCKYVILVDTYVENVTSTLFWRFNKRWSNISKMTSI